MWGGKSNKPPPFSDLPSPARLEVAPVSSSPIFGSHLVRWWRNLNMEHFLRHFNNTALREPRPHFCSLGEWFKILLGQLLRDLLLYLHSQILFAHLSKTLSVLLCKIDESQSDWTGSNNEQHILNLAPDFPLHSDLDFGWIVLVYVLW